MNTAFPGLRFVNLLSAKYFIMKWIALFVLGIVSIRSELASDFTPFHWLKGTWEMRKPNGSYRLETWENKSLNALHGKGMKVMDGDTTYLESIELYADQKEIWYTPTVPDQNNQQPVPFKLVSSNDLQYVFENPQHDFPQRIVYRFKPKEKITPFISSLGDTLDVSATSLNGEGIHFRFYRK